MSNALYYGDNLDVLRRHVADASVDLVYLDPPFQSGKDYNLVFESRAGKPLPDRAQATAFTDTWRWDAQAEDAYAAIERAGAGAVTRTMRALRAILGESDIMAYLCMMAPRLVELRRALKPTGSLYLHCDPTASHYLKVLLDGIFGPACFRNELIWRYRRWPAKARRFQRMHDVLLFYTASSDRAHTFNTLYGYEKLAESTLKTFGTRKQRADFSSGHRKPGVEEGDTQGPPLSDTWEIGVIAAIGRERTGYPTQKPETLLERIIRSSSNEGDLVLDPFCGCGTTIAVAERLNRRWAGIDVTHLAINLVRERMKAAAFEVHGEPLDREGARRLADADPFQFRCWMLGRVGARLLSPKAADPAIDGEVLFSGGPAEARVVVSVKSGAPRVADVRALRAAFSRGAGASAGVLLTLGEPPADVIAEAAKAGFAGSAESGDPRAGHPRIQILTVGDVLAGRSIEHPGANVTARGAGARPRPSRVVSGIAGPPSHDAPGIAARPSLAVPGLASTRATAAAGGRPARLGADAVVGASSSGDSSARRG